MHTAAGAALDYIRGDQHVKGDMRPGHRSEVINMLENALRYANRDL
jgi:hypothetical protein